jgi:hypothetical protein
MIAYFASASRVRCTSLSAMMRTPCYGRIWANSGLAFLPGGNVGALVGGKGLRLGFEQAQSGYITQRLSIIVLYPAWVAKHQETPVTAAKLRHGKACTCKLALNHQPHDARPPLSQGTMCICFLMCFSQQARQCQRHLIHREGSNSASCAVVC